MEASRKDLVQLFSSDDTRYIIPVYQRNYSWDVKQCRQLFNDVCSLINSEKKHFFGSIVRLSDGHDGWAVIDGQQRLTTVSLMWLSMSQLIKDKKKEASKTLTNNLRNKYCYYKDDDTILPRIEHVDLDKSAYKALIDGNVDKFIENSAITNNFWLFYHWIENSKYNLDQFDKAIKNLQIANIELDKDRDDPQAIFESLNSTGLALSDGDKIRNFMLMNLSLPLQNQYYKNYWIDIEHFSNYSGDKSENRIAVSNFVRDYLTAKTTRIPTIRDVYTKFKDYKNNNNLDTKELLEDMKSYSHYLFIIETCTSKSVKLNRVLKRLSLLGMTVLHPFELNLIKDYYEGKVSEDTLCSILELVETYIFRRSVCDVPTNTLNKTFASLYVTALKLSEKERLSLFDSVAYLLTTKAGSARFPNDSEFESAWVTKDIYKMKAYKVYIFFCLNGGKSPEGDTSVIKKMQPNEEGKTILSIEHIMPQKLTPEWVKVLGGKEQAERIQERWGDNIANLTLTAYNSKYSNNSFSNKLHLKDEKGLEVGFSSSPLPINEYVKKQTEWGEKQLEERLSLIQKNAVNVIWKMPTVKSISIETSNEVLTLEDNQDDFTNTLFIDGTLDGEAIPVEERGDWKRVFKEIIIKLDQSYHEELMLIANDTERTYLQSEKTKNKNSSLIVNGIYAKLNRSASALINYLQNILPEIGMDLDSVVFHVYRKVKNTLDV